ncbi:MAG: IS630 family transposase [Chloroflexi bacterium]|nr:MAG: IS630 family transposase [Chloroflexota bacterium]
MRLKALLNLSYEEIGLYCGLHCGTVGRYIRTYRSEGLEGLLATHYKAPLSELEAHGAEIEADFDQSPPLSIAEARHRIKEKYQIERSPTQVRAFLRRHGYSCRKLGHIPAKADPEAQQEFITQQLEPHYEQAQRGERHLFFMDAAHFVLGAFICYVWAKTRCFIRSAAGRNRINVLATVCAITQEIFCVHNTEKINAQVIMDFLQKLRIHYPKLPISIVLDNARYQHCQAVKELAKSLSITLLFLPPYSPNLNLIERLWKFAKKKVLYAKYYDTPQKFHLAVTDFFDHVHLNYKTELKTLLSFKFQNFDKKKLII